ncbi:hypothetical protein JMG10_13855 [Nostoc ellipsosporum NOK]|jgi:hypothetical protein|nr:hypothetical protein [Nostoc ellipsosporum NOK]
MPIHHIDQDALFVFQSSNDPVILWVEFGNGQPGSYVVHVDKTPIAARPIPVTGKKDRFPAVELGTVKQIGNKTILVAATVRDTSTKTNWTAVTIYLKEGNREPLVYGPYSYQVPKHLDTVIYTLTLIKK